MVSHSRLSPGIEINELDRSQYNIKENYSIVGTTVLLNGFADKGENYTTQWVNSRKTFENLYGLPTNEPERYLYNGVTEVLDRGGVCLVSKLPYANTSMSCLPTVTYRLETRNAVMDGNILRDLSSVDPSLTSYATISLYDDKPTKTTSIERLDLNKTTNSIYAGQTNMIDIIDITNQQYGSTNLVKGEAAVDVGVECLGIMPVIVSPVNALFYQNIISSEIVSDSNNNQISRHTSYVQLGQSASGRKATEPVYTYLSDYTPVTDAQNRSASDVSANYTHVNFSDYTTDNFSLLLSSDSVKDETVSRTAANSFPIIKFLGDKILDKTYLKQIGLVVFKATKDEANESRVLFTPVEAFVGSLDRNSKDPVTKASNYIGNLVNASSRYVNFFANVKTDQYYDAAATIAALGQNAPVLGFAKRECAKTITEFESIYQPLNRIFDRLQDPNQVNIDIVADAGVSTIAQFVKEFPPNEWFTDQSVTNADMFPFRPSQRKNPNGTVSDVPVQPWTFSGSRPSAWYNVVRKCDEFCKNVRRDCMFLADGFRPIFIEGNQKIVRNTKLENTLENAIIPNMKFLTGLNSSYSAGYCNWFYVIDERSGDLFWCPPSIKAAGVYVYTDAYSHTWDAPAGLTRGVIKNAYDTAFNPRNDEAGRIYQQAWNYAVNYPIDGIVLEGQKTFQLQQTALDRVNVRRLMIWLEKSIVRIARRFVYEGNTPYLRQRFTDMMRSVLEEAKVGNGISDYAIRCDDTLNTVQVIENNELRAIVAVKPIKTVEYIKLSFIVTNQSANVQEEVLRS